VTILAFAGPSLPRADRARFPGVEWRPPAQAGDLLRLVPDRPSTLCLIDGYFDHRPAVRHKEILLLLAEGVRIFGAASIGALRAAEMAPFGMVGVGAIYRAYAKGAIDGDDEVALAHAGPEWDWRPLSVPLVDVRATLCRALRERIVAAPEARALLAAAKALHYSERSWELILAGAGLRAEMPARLAAWPEAERISQKRADAEACLSAAAAGRPTALPRPAAVRTAFLDALARECGIALGPPDSGPPGAARAPNRAGSNEKAAGRAPRR